MRRCRFVSRRSHKPGESDRRSPLTRGECHHLVNGRFRFIRLPSPVIQLERIGRDVSQIDIGRRITVLD
jgi:hypothetical protein